MPYLWPQLNFGWYFHDSALAHIHHCAPILNIKHCVKYSDSYPMTQQRLQNVQEVLSNFYCDKSLNENEQYFLDMRIIARTNCPSAANCNFLGYIYIYIYKRANGIYMYKYVFKKLQFAADGQFVLVIPQIIVFCKIFAPAI